LFEQKPERGILRRSGAEELLADVIREQAPHGNGVADKRGRFTWVRREMTSEASAIREHLPLHGRITALKHLEHAIFSLEHALNRGSGEDKEGLKFPQVQQAHHRVHVRRRQKHAADGSVPGCISMRSEFGSGENLCPQIRRSADQKPDAIIGRKCNLRLSAWLCMKFSRSESRAIAARAIPLREAAARSGAENFNFHEGTPRGAMQTHKPGWRSKGPYKQKTARPPRRSGPTTQD